MNILVVGNTSMVGKRIIKRLKQNKDFNIYTAGRDKSISDIYIDLEQINLNREYSDIDIDIIIHCAASFYDNSIEGCMKNEMINSIGSLQIADLAIKTNCRKVIYISSIFSINNSANEYYGSYGISKKHGADYLEFVCKNSGIDFIELLCGSIYDEIGEGKKHQSFFYYIIDKASMGADITIYGDLDVNRNFLFVEDLVDIISILINKKITGSFVCCYPESFRISQIANIAYNVFGKNGNVRFDKSKERLKKIYIPYDNRLYEEINYTPKTDLYRGIELIKKVIFEGGKNV